MTPTDETLVQAAGDALALIDAVAGSEPAYVFGSSSGAITGLELIIRHPDRVRMLVAHEPPCTEVLPDSDANDARAFFADVYDTYREDGLTAADVVFMMGTGMDDDAMPPMEDLLPEYRELRSGWKRTRATSTSTSCCLSPGTSRIWTR